MTSPCVQVAQALAQHAATSLRASANASQLISELLAEAPAEPGSLLSEVAGMGNQGATVFAVSVVSTLLESW